MRFPASIKAFLFIITGLSVSHSTAHAQKVNLNVLTYNIRYANPGDAPNTWVQRRDIVYSVIREAAPDIFGLQEALKEQVADIEKAFTGFSRIGVGRDDGKESGEFSPLFFNTQKFKLLSSGTFWLSQTPLMAGSRGWDAACNRVVTWVQLAEKKSEKSFFVFCTHFDHMGETARQNSALLLVHAVDSLAGNKPAIILGDFNAKTDSEPYRIITDKTNPKHFANSRDICKNPEGPHFTYSGFKVGAQQGEQIDYIFLKGIIKVDAYKVNPENNGEYYPSDHLPVSAGLELY